MTKTLKYIQLTFLISFFLGCSNEVTEENKFGLKGNVKIVETVKYKGENNFGNITKNKNQIEYIEVLNFDKKNRIVESIIYNSDKSIVKELKKYTYNSDNKVSSVEETNTSKYDDNYKLLKTTYPKDNQKVTKWYNSKGEDIYTWNTTFSDDNNPLITNSYDNGILEWTHKYKYDNEKRLIEQISYKKDSSNYSKHIIYYEGSDKISETYKKDNTLFYKEVITKNKNGDIIQKKHYNSFNELSSEPTIFEYEYDKFGNWILKKNNSYTTKFDNAGNIKREPVSYITERKITYYE